MRKGFNAGDRVVMIERKSVVAPMPAGLYGTVIAISDGLDPQYIRVCLDDGVMLTMATARAAREFRRVDK